MVYLIFDSCVRILWLKTTRVTLHRCSSFGVLLLLCVDAALIKPTKAIWLFLSSATNSSSAGQKIILIFRFWAHDLPVRYVYCASLVSKQWHPLLCPSFVLLTNPKQARRLEVCAEIVGMPSKKKKCFDARK